MHVYSFHHLYGAILPFASSCPSLACQLSRYRHVRSHSKHGCMYIFIRLRLCPGQVCVDRPHGTRSRHVCLSGFVSTNTLSPARCVSLSCLLRLIALSWLMRSVSKVSRSKYGTHLSVSPVYSRRAHVFCTSSLENACIPLAARFAKDGPSKHSVYRVYAPSRALQAIPVVGEHSLFLSYVVEKSSFSLQEDWGVSYRRCPVLYSCC